MTVNMSTDIKNQLIELSCDNKLKQMFCEASLEIFWDTYAREITQN